MTQDEKEGSLVARNFQVKNARTGVTATDVDMNLQNFVISNSKEDGIHYEGNHNVVIRDGIIDGAGGHGIYIDGNPKLTRMNELVTEIQKYVEERLSEHKQEFYEDFENYRKSSISAREGYLKSMVLRLIDRGATVFVEGLVRRAGDILPLGGM